MSVDFSETQVLGIALKIYFLNLIDVKNGRLGISFDRFCEGLCW